MSRLPGFNEEYFLCRNVEGYYSNFNVVCEYNRRVTPGNLSHALQAMISDRPWLSYNFFKLHNNPRPNYGKDYELSPVELIPFENVATFTKIDKFDESTFEDLNRLKNEIDCLTTPLWQVRVMETPESQYVCVYMCHTLADGGTALQFHRDLIVQLEKFENEEKVVDVLFEDSGSVPILPPVELLTTLYAPGFLSVIKLLVQQHCPWIQKLILYFWKPKVTAPLFHTGPVTKCLDSKFKIVNFTPAEVGIMTRFCRSNAITLTPLFNVIALDCIEKVIYPLYPKESSYSSSNFVAMSGRRYFPHYSNPFLYGVMVCGLPVTFPPIKLSSDDDLMAAIRKFHDIIQSNLASRDGFRTVGLWKYINIPSLLANKIGKTDRYTTMVSNLGFVRDQKESTWKITNAWFGLNTSMGYHFILNMVTTETGGLNLVVPHVPEFEGAMDEFVARFRESCFRITEEN